MVRLLALLAATMAGAAGILAQEQSSPDSYIVEFQDEADIPSLYRILEENDVQIRMTLDYRLFKGISIDISGTDKTKCRILQDLEHVPDIKYWPLSTRSSPTDEELGPRGRTGDFSNLRKRDARGDEAFSPHALAQIDKVQAEGITGKGIKVAVIDSGIDYTHPALGGCFGPGCLVSFGTDLVGDYNGDPSTMIPDDDPKDCYGHGTHVAGIITAQSLPNGNGIIGAAPGVTLGAYKISSCNWTGIPDDITIAAFNLAFEDGADVISCSWFVGETYPDDPLTQVVSRIVEQGTPCVLSAGNQGEKGLFSTGSPSIGHGVISVGSVENSVTPSLRYGSVFQVDGKEESFTWRPEVPGNWSGDTMPVYAPKFDTCEPWTDDLPELEDRVVFIPEDSCSLKKQATLAAEKGAKYIVYPSVHLGSAATLDVSKATGIKAAALIPQQIGDIWTAALDAGSKVTVSMDRSGQMVVVNEEKTNGGQVSVFSGWGPSWDLEVKPTVLAPGSEIISTAPIDLGSYQVRTGTSMAAPLVAGVVALILEARGKDLGPSRIERLLANTAKPLLYRPAEDLGASEVDAVTMAPVPQQGAGLVRAHDAAFSNGTILSRSAITFNDTEHRVETAKFTIINSGGIELTYLVNNVAAATAYLFQDNGTSPGRVTDDYATLRFSPDELTLGPGENSTVTVTSSTEMAAESLLPVWSGWVSVSASDGTRQLIPYAGVSGSLKGHFILAGDLGVVAFSFSSPKSKEQVPVNSTFILPPPRTVDFSKPPPTSDMEAYKLTFPGVAIPFAMASRTTVVSVVDGIDGDVVGVLPQSPFERNKVSEARCGWDGRLADGNYINAGAYSFRAKSLRVFGDPWIEEDWEVKQSAVFNIEYADSIPPPNMWFPPPEVE